MFKPELDKKFTLKAKLEGTPEDGDAKFVIAWNEDLDEIKDKEHLDDRAKTILQCPDWNDLEKSSISGNEAEFEAESTVTHDTWGSNRNALEIYACIRAEYKFVVDAGYDKVQSRIGPNGIDHLFQKDGERPVLVESKTISNLTKVTGLKRDPNSIIHVLGAGRKIEVDGSHEGVAFATQMSPNWVWQCLLQLEEQSTGSTLDLITDIVATTRDMDEWPYRVVNIYGGLEWNAKGAYDELLAEAKKQRPDKDVVGWKGKRDATDGAPDFLYVNGEWISANPERGRYYLLPGKYKIRVVAAGQYTDVNTEAQEVDFADERYRDDEFFLIDALPRDVQDQLSTPNVRTPKA